MFLKLISFFVIASVGQLDSPPEFNQKFSLSAGVPNAVTGLEITPDQNVDPTDGFVFINAKCSGKVQWLVVANSPIKYVINEGVNQLILAVPPPGQEANVFCVGYVDGKFTEFARTLVRSGKAPQPPPVIDNNNNNNNNVDPAPVKGKLHMTLVYDMNQSSPEIAQLINNQSFRKGLVDKGVVFRVYDVTSPVVTSKKLDQALKLKNLTQGVVVQNQGGQLLYTGPIPKDEKDGLAIIQNLTKGN